MDTQFLMLYVSTRQMLQNTERYPTPPPPPNSALGHRGARGTSEPSSLRPPQHPGCSPRAPVYKASLGSRLDSKENVFYEKYRFVLRPLTIVCFSWRCSGPVNIPVLYIDYWPNSLEKCQLRLLLLLSDIRHFNQQIQIQKPGRGEGLSHRHKETTTITSQPRCVHLPKSVVR